MQRIQNNLHSELLLSYKELIKILDIPYKGGQSKIYQLADLERFFESIYDKYTKQYMIISINDAPNPKPPRKSCSDFICINYIEKSLRINLLKYLKDIENSGVILSKKNWWEIMGITNEVYKIYDNYDRREELLKIDILPKYMDIKNIDEFFYRTYLWFNTLVTKSLNRLKDELLISYDDDKYTLSANPDNPWDIKLVTFKDNSNISL